MENQEAQLLGRSNMPPQRQLSWLKPLTADEKTGIDELMTMIGDLKDQGLTGERVYLSFLMRRVQPLKSRANSRLSVRRRFRFDKEPGDIDVEIPGDDIREEILPKVQVRASGNPRSLPSNHV